MVFRRSLIVMSFLIIIFPTNAFCTNFDEYYLKTQVEIVFDYFNLNIIESRSISIINFCNFSKLKEGLNINDNIIFKRLEELLNNKKYELFRNKYIERNKIKKELIVNNLLSLVKLYQFGYKNSLEHLSTTGYLEKESFCSDMESNLMKIIEINKLF